MFKRLLIANRGEIAIRIARACREMGIKSIAVYSDADANAPHVAAATCSVRIGPPPATESYLSIPAIIAAAREAQADAVHPGYGFLSQNAGFARACADAGLTFVGPPAEVHTLMGSKIEARRLMTEANVPVVPGDTPKDQSDESLLRTLVHVGFPALVKASSGGGGKGMRVVRSKDEALGEIQSARREAAAAFGNGTLFVERLLEQPRHIEVQVLADDHGGVIHLYERECSIQRRHQKVIEESPSPWIGPKLRARLTDAAVRAARAAGYRNAGTVEFLVDANNGTPDEAPFYFLEMNTRLQVEHGVTELVCGLDLVQAQLRVAAGEPLPWTQDAIDQRGHAVEARLYAEDPANDFLPQAGPILLLREPHAPNVRIDSGVIEGQTITPHYDPLLAKVIAWGESREMAVRRLSAALRTYPVLGLVTNGPFLLRVLNDRDFSDGRFHTNWLEERTDLHSAGATSIPDAVEAAIAGLEDTGSASPPTSSTARRAEPWNDLRGWRG